MCGMREREDCACSAKGERGTHSNWPTSVPPKFEVKLKGVRKDTPFFFAQEERNVSLEK